MQFSRSGNTNNITDNGGQLPKELKCCKKKKITIIFITFATIIYYLLFLLLCSTILLLLLFVRFHFAGYIFKISSLLANTDRCFCVIKQ